jgi:quercetin dioxygenase-like cupin family protein
MGYTAKYIADIEFQKELQTGGFILVSVAAGTRTEPHRHEKLEEVFVALSNLRMFVDSVEYHLENGDVVLVAPNESHSFEALEDSTARILAIKFPNLKNDKVTVST